MEDYIRVDWGNISDEHICCCIGNKKCQEGYDSKKEYLTNEFENGFEFWKLDVRHKVFIQFEPIETCWYGVEGKNMNYISCFWVAGQHKGKGHGKNLLEIARDRSKGKDGIATIVGRKKLHYLSDKKIFIKNGFEVVDSNGPYELLYKDLSGSKNRPRFTEVSKELKVDEDGIVVYYSPLCPFCDYYTNLLAEGAKDLGVKFEKRYIDSRKEAKKLPHPIPIYSLYYNGEFITNEILTVKKLEKLVNNHKV